MEFESMEEIKNRNRRVVVTGLGVVSPVGIGKDVFWDSIINGKSGIGPITLFDPSSYPCKVAAEVSDFQPSDFIPFKKINRISRGSQFAIASTKKAIDDAKLDLNNEDSYRIGLVYGTALGPADVYEKFGATFYERGLKRVSPFFLGMMNHNGMIGAVAEHFELRGYNAVISGGCSSGTLAIANAFHILRAGCADVLITGGVDTPIYPLTFGLYSAAQLMTTVNGNPKQAMRPYDKRRSGFVLGEGAGTLILEDFEHAIKRNARIYAEILGCGLTNDANNVITGGSPETTHSIKAFQIALSQASLKGEDVEYISGYAQSAVMLDKKETYVIKQVFGDHAFQLAVSSIKAAIGQSMGGATTMQSIAACLALHEGILPPTINYEVKDPECDLDYVPNQPRKKNIHVAMVNTFGLGGTNVVIVYGKLLAPMD
jgi:3-oxoacyl-[acyl-carrier-protein] synthase II